MPNDQMNTTDRRRAALLEKQIHDWPQHIESGRQGNPFATLCSHCYGRHQPPRDELCQKDPPIRV
jgi:hypothetical protein